MFLVWGNARIICYHISRLLGELAFHYPLIICANRCALHIHPSSFRYLRAEIVILQLLYKTQNIWKVIWENEITFLRLNTQIINLSTSLGATKAHDVSKTLYFIYLFSVIIIELTTIMTTIGTQITSLLGDSTTRVYVFPSLREF